MSKESYVLQEESALEIAVEASHQAGAYLRQAPRSKEKAKVKETIHSVVTPIDLHAQSIIESVIASRVPGARFLSEEAHQTPGADWDHLWVVDPLDGTSYYIRGLPSYAVSIGYLMPTGFIVGVVYLPETDETFWARRKGGAYLNGNAIRTSATVNSADAILTFSHRILREARYRRWSLKMLREVRSIRAGGSCAQELAYLACGRIDGLVAARQSIWDFGPGSLIVCEAGGSITRFDGAPLDLHRFEEKSVDILAAANDPIHAWVVASMSP